jgi:hypothetical protein
MAHLSGLGLLLDFVAVDHAATIGIRTEPVALLDRAEALVLGFFDDFESAMPLLNDVQLGHKPYTGPLAVQPPVWGERHQAAAVGADDGTGPEVAIGNAIRSINRRGRVLACSIVRLIRSELIRV